VLCHGPSTRGPQARCEQQRRRKGATGAWGRLADRRSDQMRKDRCGMAHLQRTHAGGTVDTHLQRMHAGRGRSHVLQTGTGAIRGLTAIRRSMLRAWIRVERRAGRCDLRDCLGIAHRRHVLMARRFGRVRVRHRLLFNGHPGHMRSLHLRCGKGTRHPICDQGQDQQKPQRKGWESHAAEMLPQATDIDVCPS
jgi:hypothetical protein